VHVKKRKLPPPRVADIDLPSPVQGGDVLRFVRDKKNSPLISRFKQYKIAPEDSIDLHGMTASEAQPYLQQFLQESLQADYRCVRVIHGKGREKSVIPVLKNKVNVWLRESPCVVAFCSAPKGDGGVGAVYVLLT
jgi:DNA-nicking Smr family endonuclease